MDTLLLTVLASLNESMLTRQRLLTLADSSVSSTHTIYITYACVTSNMCQP